jgi:hypothetical protein
MVAMIFEKRRGVEVDTVGWQPERLGKQAIHLSSPGFNQFNISAALKRFGGYP